MLPRTFSPKIRLMFFRKKPPAPSLPLPRLPDDMRVYAIGDIHGRVDLLRKLLKQIDADAAGQHYQLVFLGDYIDRGLASREVLDTLVALKIGMHVKPVFIQGNHDQVMKQLLARRDTKLAIRWLSYGGNVTALSYGITPPIGNRDDELAVFIDKLAGAVPQLHKDFLQDMVTHFTCGDYFFCHAGVRPGVPLDAQSEDDLAWIRHDFIPHTGQHEKVIVHGHTIAEQPDIHANRIGVDTGAYATGTLTALALEGDRKWFLQTV